MNTFDTVPCMAEAPLVALWALAVQTNKHTRKEKLTLPKTRIPEWCNEGRGQASEGQSPGSSKFLPCCLMTLRRTIAKEVATRILCKSRECCSCEE